MKYVVDDATSARDFISYIKDENPKLIARNDNVVKLSDGNEYEFLEKYLYALKKLELEKTSNEYDNPIIFGKDTTENIVAIEASDDGVLELHMLDGEIRETTFNHWVLTNRSTKNSIKLEGDNYFKYLTFFPSKNSMAGYISKCKKSRIDYYNVWDSVEAATILHGYTLFKGMKITDLSVLSFDIEATGLIKDANSKVFLITNTFRDNQGNITKKHFRVDHYDDDDVAMIEDWCKWVVEMNPTILTGHYINGYDIPFLQYCYSERQGEDRVGMPLGKFHKPLKFNSKPSDKRVDGGQSWTYYKTHCYGRHIIDGVFLCIPYDITKKYPSWGLKEIAQYEGWVKEDRQFYDASKIKENWYDLEEREKIVKYGIDDSDDSIRVFDLMAVSPFYMSQNVPKSFQSITESATGGMLNSMMVRAYLQDNHSIPKTDEPTYVGGGISFGIPGVHKNVFKVDVKSMYPSIIRQYKLYPKKKDPKQYYYKLTDYFTIKRFEQKAKFKETGDTYYDDLQSTSKVFINSLYGLTSTPGLNFNDYSVANTITATSRKIIRETIKWATGEDVIHWFNTYKLEDLDERYAETVTNNKRTHDFVMVNCDTDSISFKNVDEERFTEQYLVDLLEDLNSIFPNKIEYEDDGHFDKVAVIKAKNYCMLKDGELSFKGSGFKDAKKEPVLKKLMIDIINSIMYEKRDYVDIYEECVRTAYNIKDITPWCTKMGISEKLMEANSTIKMKKLNALDNVEYQLGDKYHVFQDIDGMRQAVVKGDLAYTKMTAKEAKSLGITKQPKTEECDHSDRAICGICNPNMLKPKMIPNDIYRRKEDFTGSYDKKHYLSRIYTTVKILENVIDINRIIDYSKKENGV